MNKKLVLLKKIFKITFTGVDRYTDLKNLPNSSIIEYGILFSTTNQKNRYPNLYEIKSFSESLKNYNLALHVCGKDARTMLKNKELTDFIFNFKRIQVNGVVSYDELKEICEKYLAHEIIIQYNAKNNQVIKDYEEDLKNKNNIKNVSFLIDSSGGNGITPDIWFNPNNLMYIGYAGGLGEDNIVEQLNLIKKISSEKFWIDMESKIRDENDKFDIVKIKNILKLLQKELHVYFS